MKRPARYKTTGIVVGLLLSGWVALTACSNQGEGERCELGNNNDDCEDGLLCTPAAQIPQGFNSSDRCCPADRTLATADACREAPVGPLPEAAPPLDTGPPAQDSGNDAPAEAEAGDASDASTDG